MPFRGIYAITDDKLLPDTSFMEAVEQALAAGVCLLQYRSKSPDADRKMFHALALKTLCEQYEVPLIINDDALLAKQVGARGVHLGQQDGLISDARKLLGDEAIIGVSCHADLDMACLAQEKGADYVAFGRFFPSRSKPDAPAAALSVIEEAKARLKIPVVAIGGINPENGASLIAAGADMLALIDGIFGSDDIPGQMRRLQALFR